MFNTLKNEAINVSLIKKCRYAARISARLRTLVYAYQLFPGSMHIFENLIIV